MNLIVLVAVLSCLNSGLYITSRMLFGLAANDNAPRSMVALDSRGVPTRAILIGSVFGYLAVIASVVSPQQPVHFSRERIGRDHAAVIYLLMALAQIRIRPHPGTGIARAAGDQMWLVPVAELRGGGGHRARARCRCCFATPSARNSLRARCRSQSCSVVFSGGAADCVRRPRRRVGKHETQRDTCSRHRRRRRWLDADSRARAVRRRRSHGRSPAGGRQDVTRNHGACAHARDPRADRPAARRKLPRPRHPQQRLRAALRRRQRATQRGASGHRLHDAYRAAIRTCSCTVKATRENRDSRLRARTFGRTIEWSTQCVGIEQDDEGVTATLVHLDRKATSRRSCGAGISWPATASTPACAAGSASSRTKAATKAPCCKTWTRS